MVTKAKAKSESEKRRVKRIVDDELRKGAIAHSKYLLYRPTKSGGEVQTNRQTGERWLVYEDDPKNVKIRRLR